MFSKKGVAFSLAAGLFAVPVYASAATQDFKDVTKADSHYDAIRSLSGQNIISGYGDGTFKPYQNISRQHVAVILARSLSLPVPSDAETAKILKQYKDVSPKHDYAKQIAAVTKANVFKGSNGTFMPNHDITREQMATVLTQGFGLTKYQQDKVQVNLKNVDKSHQSAVQAIANLDITVSLKNFKPGDPLKRGQFASFLIRTQDVIANGTLVGEGDKDEDKNDKPSKPTPDKPGTDKPTNPKPDTPSNGGNDNQKPENPKPEEVKITGFDFNLTSYVYEGDTANIQLIAKKSDGSKTDVSTKAEFVSSDNKVVKITGNKVTGLKEGTVTITATYDNHKVQREFSVEAKPATETPDPDNGVGDVEGVSGTMLIDGRRAIDIGKSAEVSFTLFDKDGNNKGELSAKDMTELKAKADKPGIVKVEGNKITALKEGLTTVTFTYKGFKGEFLVNAVDQGPDEDLWGYFREMKIKADYYNKNLGDAQNITAQDIANDSLMKLSASKVKSNINKALASPNTAVNDNDSVFYYDKANNLIIVKWNRTGEGYN